MSGAHSPAAVHRQLMAHRQMLADSNFLIDKMANLATLGVVAHSVNLLMAQRADKVVSSDYRHLVAPLLQPLTLEERSLRKVLQGEIQFVEPMLEEALAGGFDVPSLGDVRAVYRYVADVSEASWDAYWSGGLDVRSQAAYHTLYPLLLPEWSDYTTNLRNLDALLTVLRALREVYEGRTSPGVPALPPPAHWHWRWEAGREQLCLEPGRLHPTLEQGVEAVCVDYLGDPLPDR